ncbi:MAG: hydroxyacid dehydrogenase [Peptococcaceae bacterium]|nr:hydroxyacid dehydrogenase [Peptococcaceae bacterium]
MTILLTGAFKYTDEQINKLKSLGLHVLFVEDERTNLQIDCTDIDGVVCNNLFLYNDISNFKNLRFIQLTSAGTDRVPLDHIKEKNIILKNARGVYSIPMAEYTVLKILEIYKKSRFFYKMQETRTWQKQRNLLELYDKTAAIIGFGSDGIEIAKRLKCFGVKIIAVDVRNFCEAELEMTDEVRSIDNIDDVLLESDIVILTVPLNEHTYKLMNRHRLSKMKDNSVLINIARGGIIDEAALIDAIEKGKFLGVALDVFEHEPLSMDSPLWCFDNVIITPHNSFVSDKVKNRLFELIVENLSQFLKLQHKDVCK